MFAIDIGERTIVLSRHFQMMQLHNYLGIVKWTVGSAGHPISSKLYMFFCRWNQLCKHFEKLKQTWWVDEVAFCQSCRHWTVMTRKIYRHGALENIGGSTCQVMSPQMEPSICA